MKKTIKKRPGRPELPPGEKKISTTIQLSPAWIEWLKAQKTSRNKLIESALVEKYGKK